MNYIFIIAVAFASFFFLSSLKKETIIKKKAKLSIRGYFLIYSDSREGIRNKNIEYSKLLKSEKYDLTGKPDYIYKKTGSDKLIPVELKSGQIKDKNMPHKGDLLQLGAYFLIIEDHYGIRPKKGHLIYKDYMFVVKNTSAIRNSVKLTLIEMRKMLENGKGDAAPSFINCRYCVCRGTVCEKIKN